MRHLTLSWKRSVTQVYEGASVGITDKIWEEFLLPLPGEYVVFPSDYSVFFNVCGAKASNPNHESNLLVSPHPNLGVVVEKYRPSLV